MDRTKASDAFNAGSIPVRYILNERTERQSVDMKEKVSELWHSFREWCKDIGGLIKDHKTVSMAIGIFILLMIFAVIISVVIGNGKKAKQAAMVKSTESTKEAVFTVPDEPLQKNAIPEVNVLVKEYYQYMAEGNKDMIRTIMTGLDDKELIKIEKKSGYVESYPSITCYTKRGPLEDSYLVYVYYEVKLVDFDVNIPGLNALYVCKNEEGSYYINGETQPDEVINYCEVLSSQDEVVDLINTVQVRYNELKAENEELSKFLDELPDRLTAEVGEELAKLEAAEKEPETEEAAEEETEEAETADKEIYVQTTDVVNVRSSDSQEADKVGKALLGEKYLLLEEKANGWSKISFEGKEAFIKTEFLEVVSEEEAEDEEGQEKSPEEEKKDEEAAADSPTEGKAIAKETINVRKKASTSSDKVTVCYQGEPVEVIMKQADGWTKIKYKNKTGYVKSEFLE